jgi:hypothetical protein
MEKVVKRLIDRRSLRASKNALGAMGVVPGGLDSIGLRLG